MNSPKSPKTELPPEIKEAIDNSFKDLMKKFQSLAKEVPEVVLDCPDCDNKGTVRQDPEYIYENKSLGVKLNIPAMVCSHCNAVSYSTESFMLLLQTEEAAQGRPYVRFEEKNGQLLKHTLH